MTTTIPPPNKKNEDEQLWSVRGLRPRRPRCPRYSSNKNRQPLDAQDNHHDEHLINYLESVLYGEEDADILERFYSMRSSTTEDDAIIETTLPWNIQWRLWLLRKTAPQRMSITTDRETNNRQPASEVLPSILAQLQSQVLFLLMDDDNDDAGHERSQDMMNVILMAEHIPQQHRQQTNNNSVVMQNDHSCWQQDPMLAFWKQHQRFHVVKDLHDFWNQFTPSEQKCVTEIIQAIDQMTGCHHHYHQQQASSSDARAIVQAFLQQTNNTTDKTTMAGRQEPNTAITKTTIIGNRNSHSLDTFHDWISSQMNDVIAGRHECLKKLCRKVGLHGTRGDYYYKQFVPSIRQQSQDPEARLCLSQQLPWLGTIIEEDEHGDNDEVIIVRGKALILFAFLSQGIGAAGQAVAKRIDERQQQQQMHLLLRKWQTVDLSRAKDAHSLLVAVDHYLLVQPRQTKVTPNVDALAATLWDHAFSKTPSDAASHVLEVTKQVSLWLPFQPLIPRYRSKIEQFLSVPATIRSMDTEMLDTAENVAEDIVPPAAATDGPPRMCRRRALRDMTIFVLTCCHGQSSPIQEFWRELLNDETICNTILPLYFWHSLLVVLHTTHNNDYSSCPWSRLVMDIIQCFCDFLETLLFVGDEDTKNPELILEAVPAIQILLDLFVDLDGASLQKVESTILTDNFRRLCRIRDQVHKPNIGVGKGNQVLPLPMFCTALVEFCQECGALLPTASDEWVVHIVSQIQRQQWEREELFRGWIAGLVQFLHGQEGDYALSPVTEKLHRRFMLRRSDAIVHPKTCLFETLSSEVAKAEAGEAIIDIIGIILRCSPPECVFDGCEEFRMETLLAQALSLCDNFDFLRQVIHCIIVGAALQLSKIYSSIDEVGHDHDDASIGAWAKCKLVTLDFFKAGLQSSRLDYLRFEALQKQVKDTLASRETGSDLAWWKVVCDDVQKYCHNLSVGSDNDTATVMASRKRLAPEVGNEYSKYAAIPGSSGDMLLPRRRQGKHINRPRNDVSQHVSSPQEQDFAALAADCESASHEESDDNSDSDEILLLDLN